MSNVKTVGFPLNAWNTIRVEMYKIRFESKITGKQIIVVPTFGTYSLTFLYIHSTILIFLPTHLFFPVHSLLVIIIIFNKNFFGDQ